MDKTRRTSVAEQWKKMNDEPTMAATPMRSLKDMSIAEETPQSLTNSSTISHEIRDRTR